MATYGVAITIPEPWGPQLQAAREGVGDPMAPAIPPHVTLLPPTEIADHLVDDFHAHLVDVAAAHEPFDMVLSGTGTFRPVSPVVFVMVSQGISSCERLESAVRAGPVRRDLEFNYHPHVTVAHHLGEAQLDRAFDELADFRCRFVVDRIDFYAHCADKVWRPRLSFALGADRPERA